MSGTRRATLVLSGGGAKGAFQVGAERVLREEHGFEWERVFGISVGSLNAALVAQGRTDELRSLWSSLRDEDIYHKYSWAKVAWRLTAQRKLGIYDNTPLRALLDRHVRGHSYRIPAHVGRVSLVTGMADFVSSSVAESLFLDAVWQSTTMPFVWEPIGSHAFVDGGLRHMTPLGDALDMNPTEIVVVVCAPPTLRAARRPSNLVEVLMRGLVDITFDEIMRNDVDLFFRMNSIVEQAARKGVTLHDDKGKAYRYCPITFVQPDIELGQTLDFSQTAIRHSLAHGERRARLAATPPPPVNPRGGGASEMPLRPLHA